MADNNPYYFCTVRDLLTFTEATVYAPLILMFILYLPTITYISFISIRFYGFKNWIKEIINDPVYFIFPILTSMSFYEKSKLNYQKNCGKNEQLSVLGRVSRDNQNVDTSGHHGDINKTNDDGIETVEDNLEITIEQHGDIYNIDKTDVDGIKTVEDTFETTIETLDEITVDKTYESGVEAVNDTSQNIETIEQHRDKNNFDQTHEADTIKTTDELTVNEENVTFPSVETEKQLSIRQSYTIFCLFCVSSSLCIFGDLWYQWMRGKRLNPNKVYSRFFRDPHITIHLNWNDYFWGSYYSLGRLYGVK